MLFLATTYDHIKDAGFLHSKCAADDCASVFHIFFNPVLGVDTELFFPTAAVSFLP